MAEIRFTLSKTSTGAGWDPRGDAPHDALWRDFASAYEVAGVHPGRGWGLDKQGIAHRAHPSQGGKDAVGSAAPAPGAVLSSADGDLAIGTVRFGQAGAVSGPKGGAAAALEWSADGASATLASKVGWGVIGNVHVDRFTGSRLVLENWVDAWVRLDNAFGQEVRIDGAKRGEVSTGSGADVVWIGADSDGPGSTNHFRIDTGAGDDVVRVTHATRDYTATGGFAPAYDPSWTTTDIRTGDGDDVVHDGS